MWCPVVIATTRTGAGARSRCRTLDWLRQWGMSYGTRQLCSVVECGEIRAYNANAIACTHTHTHTPRQAGTREHTLRHTHKKAVNMFLLQLFLVSSQRVAA